MSKNPNAVALGALGGRTKGPTKARDPEKMRAAARKRWALQAEVDALSAALERNHAALQPQTRAANDSRYYMQDQFDGTFTLRRSDSFEAVARGLTRAQAEAAVRAANAAKREAIPTHDLWVLCPETYAEDLDLERVNP